MSSLWLLRRNSDAAEPPQQPPTWVEARPSSRGGGRHKKLRSLSLSRLSPRKLLGSSSSELSSPAIPRSRRSLLPSSPKMAPSDDITLHWLEQECPTDLLPKILSFAGPKAMSVLSKTCRTWRNVVRTEAVWRTLCEDQYKWSEGDPIPSSWRDYYRDNPCVPIDFSSIQAALAVASDHDEATSHADSNVNPRVMEQRRSIRILLRPGRYVLRRALNIHAIESAQVTIETIEAPHSTFFSYEDDHTLATEVASPSFSRRASILRNRLSCRYANSVLDDIHLMEEDITEFPLQESFPESPASPELQAPGRATLVLKTRRHNEPIFRVRQGTLNIKNLELIHNCHGTDIWNGNAAVQVQPPIGPDDRPVVAMPRPSVSLEKVDVVSRSGRGIVNIDGGFAIIKSSYIHDCAATGIYVGGPGSHALIEKTDVISNGNGNKQSRRGIARGHSGIYLEQGTASIQNCNISRNSLTGISAVSPDNAMLNLQQSDLVANGTVQLELPPNGSVARRRSSTQDNFMAPQGMARSRSGLAADAL